MIRSLEASASEYLGQIRLDPVVFDPEQTDRIVDALGLDPETASEEAMTAFGETHRGADHRRRAATRHPAHRVGSIRDVFGELEDEGLVDLLDIDGTAVGSAEFDVVILTDRNLPHDPATVLTAIVAPPEGEPADTS